MLLAAVALMAAISAILVGTRPAQAGGPPAVDAGAVRMYVSPNHAILCLKQKKVFTVTISRSLTLTYPDGTTSPASSPYPVYKVAFDNSNSDIGAVAVDKGIPYQVSFTARKIGLTHLTIKAIGPPVRAGDPPVTPSKEVLIEVIDCGFKVSAVVDWSGSRMDQTRHFTGHMSEVNLAPGTGDVFTATGTVEWMEDIAESCCVVKTVPGLLKTTALIEGKLDDQGMILDFAFVSLSHSTCGTGGGGTKCLPDQWKFDHIHLFFPIEDVASTQRDGQFSVTLVREFSK